MKYLIFILLLILAADLYNEIYVIKLAPVIIKPLPHPAINYDDPNLMNDGRKPDGMANAKDGSHRDWNVVTFREE